MKAKQGVVFGVLGLLAGGLIALGFQVHAAQVQSPAPIAPQVQSSVQSGTAGGSASISDAKDSPETGTLVEQPDGTEKNVAETDANVSGSGHTDPSGNVNHQFEGEE